MGRFCGEEVGQEGDSGIFFIICHLGKIERFGYYFLPKPLLIAILVKQKALYNNVSVLYERSGNLFIKVRSGKCL